MTTFTHTTNTLTTYTCPSCRATVDTLARAEVGHRCPSKRNVWTTWKVES